MHQLAYRRCSWLAAALLVLALVPFVHAQTAPAEPAAPAGWGTLRTANDTRSLDYSATPALMGRATPVTVRFYCNPKSDKQSRGTLGFDIIIKGVATLKPFNFDDFEGPDAIANGKQLVRVAVVRNGKPAQAFSLAQSGSYSDTGVFRFGLSAESRLPKSAHRSILEASGQDASSMVVVISDPRNAKLQLEIRIPVGERRADFKALLAGIH